MCAHCTFINFSSRKTCKNCEKDRLEDNTRLLNVWICQKCNADNFPNNERCHKCKEDKK